MSETAATPQRWIRRFDKYDRLLHALLMSSFLGLALTGLPLFVSHARWAGTLAHAFGGFKAAATLHRIFATGMLVCFTLHLFRLGHRLLVKKERSILWGPGSMVPQPKDLKDFAGHIRWFVGRGPRPAFDRFTYWEKFDYWAVFWGMGIIGGTGLVLWFPRLFATFLPGQLFNVALLVHGEEALLAVGFITTIHFFNGHLRPEKFPLDPVIFTGVIPEEELKRERPAEHARLVANGQLEALSEPEPPKRLVRLGYIVGWTAIPLGLTLVGLTAWAVLR
jgi:cytochrome b subunit of formate dehydrogenase